MKSVIGCLSSLCMGLRATLLLLILSYSLASGSSVHNLGLIGVYVRVLAILRVLLECSHSSWAFRPTRHQCSLQDALRRVRQLLSLHSTVDHEATSSLLDLHHATSLLRVQLLGQASLDEHRLTHLSFRW